MRHTSIGLTLALGIAAATAPLHADNSHSHEADH